MKIKIFTGTPTEVERRVNRFSNTVQVVGIEQSTCCFSPACGCGDDQTGITVVVTVLYYEHCIHKFYGMRF